jgi:two-component system, LytTR family, sensor kinase
MFYKEAILTIMPPKTSISISERLLQRPLTPAAYVRVLPLSFAIWTVIVVLKGGQVLMNDASQGYVLPLQHYFVWAGLDLYSWALFTPLIFSLAFRFPFTRSKWVERLVFPHALACVVCISVQAFIRATGGYFYAEYFERPTSWLSMAVANAIGFAPLYVLAYCIIVIFAAFLHLQDEIRRREVAQAQLQVRLASAELETLRMQIQPHFLFNTLQAAITLVQDDPRAAEDVLLRLSQLLRIALDQMGKNEIPLSRELEFLDLYVGIQKQRFGDRLTTQIHADPAVLDQLVPPLLLQPLVENAIRHGIGKHKGSDLIEVFARVANRGIEIEVWNSNSTVDDTTDQLLNRGVGIRNTRARLEQLYGPGSSLLLRSLGTRGVVALIFIPLSQEPQTQRSAVVGASS